MSCHCSRHAPGCAKAWPPATRPESSRGCPQFSRAGLAAGYPTARGVRLRPPVHSGVREPRERGERGADPGVRTPGGRAERIDPLFHCRQPRHVRDALRADPVPTPAAPIRLYAWGAIADLRHGSLFEPHDRGSGRRNVPSHPRCGHALDRPQSLHHGIHPQAGPGAQRIDETRARHHRLDLGSEPRGLALCAIRDRRTIPLERRLDLHPDRAVLVPASLGELGHRGRRSPSIPSRASAASSRSHASAWRG
jgi:hypothetical protein